VLAQVTLVVAGLDLPAQPAVVVQYVGVRRHAYRDARRDGGVAEQSHADRDSDHQSRPAVMRFMSDPFAHLSCNLLARSPFSSPTGSPRHQPLVVSQLVGPGGVARGFTLSLYGPAHQVADLARLAS
jgi:hypothetical protein